MNKAEMRTKITKTTNENAILVANELKSISAN